jgi:LPS export ABC transporter protein LptC
MKFHRNTIWLIPLSIIISFPLWSIPVSDFLAPRGTVDPAPIQQDPDTHNFNMDTVRILQNQKGKNTAIIRAAKARTGQDSDTIIMELVNADLFDAEGNVTKVIANTGEYSTTTKILTLTDDVVVNKIQDNQFLYTDLLHYDAELRTVRCPGKTRLEGDKIEIDGGSLEYDIKSEKYVIDQGVHCIIDGFLKP